MDDQTCGTFVCAACGKSYAWQQPMAGRAAKCACGAVVHVPAKPPNALDTAEGEYDVSGAAPEPAQPPVTTSMRMDVMLAAQKAARRAQREQRERDEDQAKIPQESPVRDWIVPVLLVTVGVFLLGVEARHAGAHPATTVSALVLAVFTRVVLYVGLMLGSMFLAVRLLDVTLIGPLQRNLFKLAAIVLGPAAINGLLQHALGGLGGSVAGVFGSVVAYAILFVVIMRTDARDTSICVLTIWTLITAVNYAAYKVESVSRGSYM